MWALMACCRAKFTFSLPFTELETQPSPPTLDLWKALKNVNGNAFPVTKHHAFHTHTRESAKAPKFIRDFRLSQRRIWGVRYSETCRCVTGWLVILTLEEKTTRLYRNVRHQSHTKAEPHPRRKEAVWTPWRSEKFHVPYTSFRNQQINTCEDIQLYIFIHHTDMFRSFLWPSSGCRTVRIQAIYVFLSSLVHCLYSGRKRVWRWSQKWTNYISVMNKIVQLIILACVHFISVCMDVN